ncbi:MAG: hypothetical protein JNK05_38235 [Myxococcales bacterium]|nr:hypothetical protein [Myxococcales bacterium]
MRRDAWTLGVVALAFGACLPERFRSPTDATSQDTTREDVTSDRAVEDTTVVDVPTNDVPEMDAADVVVDVATDTLRDAATESSADVADVASDTGTCAAPCTANSACVSGTCVARSCLGVRELRMGSATDGEYTIDPDGAGAETPFTVYCADLASTPREYLSVDPSRNILRTVDSNTIPVTSTNDCGNWDTRWSRVRLLIDTRGASPTYAIDAGDFRFVSETVAPACMSGNLFRTTRLNMANNPYHRIYGAPHACEYRGLNQYFRGNLSNTGFRFPPDRVSRYKIENFSSGQANSFAMWEGAYGYVVAVDAQCGSLVPVEWDRGSPGEPAAAADGTPPTAQSDTWRIPIVRATTPDADPPPGASCNNPIVTAPLGSDLRRSGLFQAKFSTLPGMAPTGASCESAGMPAEAVWLSVEVPAMTQRRLVAESGNTDPVILRVVNACGGDCTTVSTTSTIPSSGTTSVVLDNRMNPMARTFYVAASSRSSSSRFGERAMNFVVQRVEPSCHSIIPGTPAGLSLPTLNGTSVDGRRLTLDWSLGACATGAYAEICRDAGCSTSYCGGGSAVPCSYHMPAMSPRFDINFRSAGTYYVRLRSLRFWIPGAGGEPVYGSEVITSTTTTPQLVVIP